MKRTLSILSISLSFLTTGLGDDRVALVIGNDAYPDQLALKNAVRDATAFGNRMEEGGYRVFRATNAGIRETLKILREFCDAARGAEIAVFFYSGHGVEVEGKNFMIPIDANLLDQVDLDLEVLSLEKLQRDLGASGSELKVIILNCCRDNPFARKRSWMKRTRSLGVGLAEGPAERHPGGHHARVLGGPGESGRRWVGRRGT